MKTEEETVEPIVIELSPTKVEKNEEGTPVSVIYEYQPMSHSSIRVTRLVITFWVDGRYTFKYRVKNASNHRTRTTWLSIEQIKAETGHIIPKSEKPVFHHTIRPGKSEADEKNGFWEDVIKAYWHIVAHSETKMRVGLDSRRGT